MFAPSETHFHQFVVPILQFRRDCTCGDLAAMRLPRRVQGLGSCEVDGVQINIQAYDLVDNDFKLITDNYVNHLRCDCQHEDIFMPTKYS